MMNHKTHLFLLGILSFFVIFFSPEYAQTDGRNIKHGHLNEGGDVREYGWGRFPATFKDMNGAKEFIIAPQLYHDGKIKNLRIYNQYLLTSEIVGNYQTDLETKELTR